MGTCILERSPRVKNEALFEEMLQHQFPRSAEANIGRNDMDVSPNKAQMSQTLNVEKLQ